MNLSSEPEKLNLKGWGECNMENKKLYEEAEDTKTQTSYRKDGYTDKALNQRFLFRNILPEEADQAVRIEEICFPPNEACSEQMMREKSCQSTGAVPGCCGQTNRQNCRFLNGLATNECIFRDEFFTDAKLYDPAGRNVMLLGLDVLPEYRGQGLASEIVSRYLCREREQGRESVILTCLDSKVKMYEKMGFQDRGMAQSSWGGEQWHEMIYVLNK